MIRLTRIHFRHSMRKLDCGPKRIFDFVLVLFTLALVFTSRNDNGVANSFPIALINKVYCGHFVRGLALQKPYDKACSWRNRSI